MAPQKLMFFQKVKTAFEELKQGGHCFMNLFHKILFLCLTDCFLFTHSPKNRQVGKVMGDEHLCCRLKNETKIRKQMMPYTINQKAQNRLKII